MPYCENYYSAQDGLQLYYRDYGDPLSPATPVLCLPGLTRNAKDFAELAEILSRERRVLCPDLRGRGRSAWDANARNYSPLIYLSDLRHLLTAAGCHRVIVIGTSLGGLLGMGMGVAMPAALAALVLNDIGPDIEPNGGARVQRYLGGQDEAMSEAQACARLRERYSAALPDFDAQDWAAEARRSYALGDDGLYRTDYDPAIAAANAKQMKTPIDLWPYFHSLRDTPVLAIRGALSDILSEKTFERMAAEKPDLTRVTVPNRGHTPLLNEPECVHAIAKFLESGGREH